VNRVVFVKDERFRLKRVNTRLTGRSFGALRPTAVDISRTIIGGKEALVIRIGAL